jgi:NADH-quinone oxidoreductase subunit L
MDNPIQTDFIRWIVFLPLLGAIVNGLLGAKIQKSMGKGAIGLIACAPVVIAFGLSVWAFLILTGLEPEKRFLIDNLYRWIDLGSLKVDMAFVIDPLSAVMILVVTGIGGLIHIYATGYMHDDNAFWRFFAYLNLFTAAMLTLVLGDSLLVLFVGWEGVGLCSYALIGFWYTDHANARAGNKAFIVNRIGDFGFVLGMFLLFWSLDAQGHGTLTFREMVKWAPTIKDMMIWGMPVATLATLFLFVGATGKSAQIPLFVWLPDAMAGPTPVSALIHAATMVTAGVYMTARMNVFFSMAPETLNLIAVIGVATALVAATIALTQYDIKKVLAYSTVSQLGYMFIGVGVGGYAAAVFHLMTHAFFKACLFLGSGSVIHAMHHEQDMRKMGGLKQWMPITFATFFVSVLAIAGFPPFAGFFSKDEILWLAASNHHWGIWFFALCGAGMTAFYMFRQLFMTFYGECRADHHTREHLHESPSVMTMPLVVLAAGAVLAGFIGLPAVLGGSQFAHWLEPVIHAHAEGHGSHAMEWGLMALSVGVASCGAFTAYLMYRRESLSPGIFAGLAGGFFYRLFDRKWYFDEIYQVVFVNGCLLLANILSAFDKYVIDGMVNGAAALTRFFSWLNGLFDQYIIDGIVNAVANITFWVGNKARRVQTGNINGYLYGILIAVALAIIVKIRYWS